MRANKLETVLSRDCLACLAPPDMFFSYRSTPAGMGVFGAPAQPVTGDFWSKRPCPLYCSRCGGHYIGNEWRMNVISSETDEALVFWVRLAYINWWCARQAVCIPC